MTELRETGVGLTAPVSPVHVRVCGDTDGFYIFRASEEIDWLSVHSCVTLLCTSCNK